MTRLLHAAGIPSMSSASATAAVGGAAREDLAAALRELGRLPRHRSALLARIQLVDLFGVTVRPSLQTADAIYDQILACLGEDAFRPRALYARFGIEVLATTDDPCDDLGSHRALADDPPGRGG